MNEENYSIRHQDYHGNAPGYEARHTPTPWYRNVSPAYKYPIYADKNGDPKGKDWVHVAAVLSGNPNQEADLDFIIRAVNSHEALLEALKLALTIYRAANNKTELWEAWVDNLGEEIQNVVADADKP